MLFYVGATINAMLWSHQHNNQQSTGRSDSAVFLYFERTNETKTKNEKLKCVRGTQNTFTWTQVPTRHKTIGCVRVCYRVCVLICSIAGWIFIKLFSSLETNEKRIEVKTNSFACNDYLFCVLFGVCWWPLPCCCCWLDGIIFIFISKKGRGPRLLLIIEQFT